MRKAAIACFAVLDYTKQRILVECSQVVEEEKTDMIFGEKTEEQKRVAELVREVKELRKELLASKLDKKQIVIFCIHRRKINCPVPGLCDQLKSMV